MKSRESRNHAIMKADQKRVRKSKKVARSASSAFIINRERTVMGKNVMGEEPLCEKTGDYCEKEQAKGSKKCKKCRRYKQGRRKQRDKEKQIRI